MKWVPSLSQYIYIYRNLINTKIISPYLTSVSHLLWTNWNECHGKSYVSSHLILVQASMSLGFPYNKMYLFHIDRRCCKNTCIIRFFFGRKQTIRSGLTTSSDKLVKESTSFELQTDISEQRPFVSPAKWILLWRLACQRAKGDSLSKEMLGLLAHWIQALDLVFLLIQSRKQRQGRQRSYST